MSQVRRDQLTELRDENVRELRRQVEAKQLDRDKAARFRLVCSIDGAERAGANLMQHTKRPEGVGRRRTGYIRIQCGFSSAEGKALLH